MLEAHKKAILLVARNKRYLLLWVVAAVVFFSAYALLPVALIPGNSIGLQLSLLSLESVALFALFSVLAGLLVSLEAYAWQHGVAKVHGTAVGAGSSLVAVFAAIVKGPLCASCIAAIAGFFGLGLPAVLFVLQYRNEIAFAAIALVVFSLHYSIKRVHSKQGICECCS